MPNGGFGCGYCRFYTPGKCHLRDAAITSDHWTVCANVTYLDGEPTSVRRFLGYRSLDTTGIEVKGSIFAITADEGAYSQVPWLEKSEIVANVPATECIICNEVSQKTKKISWKDQVYYFCSYAHYREWRNEVITSGQAHDEVTPPSISANFTELDVIKENTTSEQRKKALGRAKLQSVWEFLRRGLIWLFIIKIILFAYHAIFGN